MKTLIVQSDDGRKYEVNNPNFFYDHLTEYHSKDKNGDSSLHEENGYYFTVTPNFYNLVKNWINQNN